MAGGIKSLESRLTLTADATGLVNTLDRVSGRVSKLQDGMRSAFADPMLNTGLSLITAAWSKLNEEYARIAALSQQWNPQVRGASMRADSMKLLSDIAQGNSAQAIAAGNDEASIRFGRALVRARNAQMGNGNVQGYADALDNIPAAPWLSKLNLATDIAAQNWQERTGAPGWTLMGMNFATIASEVGNAWNTVNGSRDDQVAELQRISRALERGSGG